MLQLCGCYYYIPSEDYYAATAKHYLPKVKNQSHTTILSTASRTTLVQTFSNPSSSNIDQCFYTFPLYEGVSVVGFTCRVGSRVLHGVVKEKSKAKESYDKAVAQGETAGLLEQLPEASDVFSTKLGNILAGETVHVDITYVGELKYDAEANGIRFTIPTAIAPRYGTQPRTTLGHDSLGAQELGGIEITVDINMPEGSLIQGIQSPSHPIAVTLGKTSSSSTDSAVGMHRASATLSSASTGLDQDFILTLQATDHNAPKALLEIHPSIPNQRALMVTLVPSFSLRPSRPEIVFMADRSGSMSAKIPTLVSAMRIFLKSLPVGVKFNICSFGSSHSFLWPRSRAYSKDSLQEAMTAVQAFSANFGGTEIFEAMQATIANRFVDLPCEVILLTDGEIWDQNQLFVYLNKEVKASKAGLRVFTLGIGRSVSHALVEGIARAGKGFAQTVGENEKFDKKVVRMLKGALSPHLNDCEMEVKYESSGDSDDDFELIEKVTDSLRVLGTHDTTGPGREAEQKPISFYEEPQTSDRMECETSPSAQNADADPYAHLPAIPAPKLLQTPSTIPPLFSFSRTVIYILLSEKAAQQTPKSVILRASSSQGPLELTVPVEVLSKPGKTIHQLAARRTIQEFEEGRGWIFDSREETGALLREKFPGQFEEIVEREGVRLGTQFQVSGRWLAFVAVAENGQQMPGQEQGMGGINRRFSRIDDSRSGTTARFTSTAYSQSSVVPCSSHNVQQLQAGAPPASPWRCGVETQDFQPLQQQQDRDYSASRGGGLYRIAVGSRGGGPWRGASGYRGGGPRKRKLCNRFLEPNITTPLSPSDEVIYSLISLQTFAGFWELNDELLNTLSIPREKLRFKKGGADNENAWVTLLVIRFLEAYMQEEKDVWELVVDKARAWLSEGKLVEARAEEEVDRVLKEVKG